jgi:hypothetical protein
VNRGEELEPVAGYGDSGVRTMGELADKVIKCVMTSQIYGATAQQLECIFASNKPEDTRRCINELVNVHALACCEVGGKFLYFGGSYGARLEVARAVVGRQNGNHRI